MCTCSFLFCFSTHMFKINRDVKKQKQQSYKCSASKHTLAAPNIIGHQLNIFMQMFEHKSSIVIITTSFYEHQYSYLLNKTHALYYYCSS